MVGPLRHKIDKYLHTKLKEAVSLNTAHIQFGSQAPGTRTLNRPRQKRGFECAIWVKKKKKNPQTGAWACHHCISKFRRNTSLWERGLHVFEFPFGSDKSMAIIDSFMGVVSQLGLSFLGHVINRLESWQSYNCNVFLFLVYFLSNMTKSQLSSWQRPEWSVQ